MENFEERKKEQNQLNLKKKTKNSTHCIKEGKENNAVKARNNGRNVLQELLWFLLSQRLGLLVATITVPLVTSTTNKINDEIAFFFYYDNFHV